jgi:SAM-dependent methyltransferase
MTELRPRGSAYSFGDADIAARRLEVVAQVYGPSSRALLASAVTRPPGLAYDLGCGPGYTTALVSDQTRARRTIGLDSSAAHVARARESASAGKFTVEFAVHDVLCLPFPAGPADLVYCRLLLAHLPDPAAAVLGWAAQLAPGGLVVVDEIEWIRTSHPLLRAHLSIAEALVAAGGARMCAGAALTGLRSEQALECTLARITEVPVPQERAAAMFGMNIAAWGSRPVALGICSQAEIDEVASGLAALADSPPEGAEITWGMHQAAYALAAAVDG